MNINLLKENIMYKLIFFLSILFINQPAFSEYAISASEIMQMPPFCRGLSAANFQSNAIQFKKEMKVPGQHTQHFCHGMKALIRKNYSTAITEFDYVQSHSTKQHALIPATSLYKAEAFGKLGKVDEALAEYNKAIHLKKKYTQAYTKLSYYYLTLKKKNRALETIKLGIKYSPNSKSLKRRLKKLQE